MINRNKVYIIITLICVFNTSHIATAEMFLTPRLRVLAGYDANRLRVADDQEGSAFLETAPGLGLVLFTGESMEWLADIEYAPRLFLGGAKGDQATFHAGIGTKYSHESMTYELWGGGGNYRDSEIPNDDVRWLVHDTW